MTTITGSFGSYSVDNLAAAKAFYSDKLGLEVTETPEGLGLNLPNGGKVFMYPKEDHAPATFTVLNFEVSSVESAVDSLIGAGVTFEHYDEGSVATDEKGILWGKKADMGPNIAWFKDPAGNILSVVEV